MTESIKTLYKKIILENSRNPFNQSEMEKPDLFFTAYNPMCGDKYNFYLKLNDNKVIDASFTGYGCSISKASSSILVKKIIGSSVPEVKKLIADFLELLDTESKIEPHQILEDEDLLAFSAARNFPERIQCAELGWKELEQQIL